MQKIREASSFGSLVKKSFVCSIRSEKAFDILTVHDFCVRPRRSFLAVASFFSEIVACTHPILSDRSKRASAIREQRKKRERK